MINIDFYHKHHISSNVYFYFILLDYINQQVNLKF